MREVSMKKQRRRSLRKKKVGLRGSRLLQWGSKRKLRNSFLTSTKNPGLIIHGIFYSNIH
uniref:Uncharacterized protein n=1 Tax=Brassica oleracea TaxID=3712 RepID=A0A3P6DYW3_BRAOL|nr:unnamed protein product [Brassica oleracea]